MTESPPRNKDGSIRHKNQNGEYRKDRGYISLVNPNHHPSWQKNRFGQTTKYKPEYCEKVIMLGVEGNAAIFQICIALGISKRTLQTWRKEYSEFGEAYDMAQDHNIAVFYEQVKEAAFKDGKNLAQNVVQSILRNLHGWKDQTNRNEHDIKIDIKTNPREVAWKQFIDESKQLEDGKTIDITPDQTDKPD